MPLEPVVPKTVSTSKGGIRMRKVGARGCKPHRIRSRPIQQSALRCGSSQAPHSSPPLGALVSPEVPLTAHRRAPALHRSSTSHRPKLIRQRRESPTPPSPPPPHHLCAIPSLRCSPATTWLDPVRLRRMGGGKRSHGNGRRRGEDARFVWRCGPCWMAEP
jgi:hypothetical protein